MNSVNKYGILVGQIATDALLEEVFTAPKPGLVDPFTAGAHKDMDLFTFKQSAKALSPYFEEMALRGIFLYKDPEKLFAVIRQIGLKAEQAMYQATGGINTHKGAIFTMGIFSAAAGACLSSFRSVTLENLLETELRMTRRILLAELAQLKSSAPKSSGERNLFLYGSTGIRGEAAEGYPSIRNYGLPVLEEGISSGQNWNLVKLQVLMTLMSRVEDGNILSRTGTQGLKQVQSLAGVFLKTGGAYVPEAERKLQLLDTYFTKMNYSSGGCADLLAAAIFINRLTETFKNTEEFLCRKENDSKEKNWIS